MNFFVVLGVIAFVLCYFRFVSFRLIINKPFLTIYYSLVDFVLYFAYKRYNICPTGEMICFSAHFGKGKTLSAVHRISSYYRRYNNKKIYDPKKKKWLTQKVHVISNVKFNDIPTYQPLVSLGEIVNNCLVNKSIDDENDTITVLLVLVDEASVQLNSRNFKSNINADFLNTLLTSRHYHMSMYYTSQKFNLTDKLLRDVTQYVYECNKIWRFQTQKVFDGTELENTNNVQSVKPLRRTGFFVRNRDYNRFDTLAVVDNLVHSFNTNDFLSEKEILELRQPHLLNVEDTGEKKKKFLS